MAAAKGTKPWNAGTSQGWTDKRGYRWIYVTEGGRRRAKREHRHIMELHLGRKLGPEELVHHKNEDRADNRIENLVLSQWDEHTILHHTGSTRPDMVKQRIEVLATYREENKRLKEINSELLSALERFVEGIEHSPTCAVSYCINNPSARKPSLCPWCQANAAIAKARGEVQP